MSYWASADTQPQKSIIDWAVNGHLGPAGRMDKIYWGQVFVIIMSHNSFVSYSERMSDGEIISVAERKDEHRRVDLKGTRRKESMRQPYHSIRQVEQLSEKKIPSIYNGSVSLETLEHESQFEEKGIIEHLRQRVSQLEQEISALHSSYTSRIEQLTAQNGEKSEIYLNLIDQIHNKHRLEKQNYLRIIAEFEQERSQISTIEDKMNFINSGIEDILCESAELNQRNKELVQLIQEKDDIIQDKEEAIKSRDDAIKENQELLEKIQAELKSCRIKVKEYDTILGEYHELKQWCLNTRKELIAMIDQAHSQVSTGSSESEGELCTSTKLDKSLCSHCKISRMQQKLNDAMSKLQ